MFCFYLIYNNRIEFYKYLYETYKGQFRKSNFQMISYINASEYAYF